jgi:hypothetical protein
MKRIMATCLLLTACEPAYSVRQSDMPSTVHNDMPIPAQRDDGTPVRLESRAFDYAKTELRGGRGDRVLVRPRNTKTRAAWVLAGIGAALVVGAVGSFAAINQPANCHDESCWVAQVGAGGGLLAFGSAFLITGGVLHAVSTHDAEVQ